MYLQFTVRGGTSRWRSRRVPVDGYQAEVRGSEVQAQLYPLVEWAKSPEKSGEAFERLSTIFWWDASSGLTSASGEDDFVGQLPSYARHSNPASEAAGCRAGHNHSARRSILRTGSYTVGVNIRGPVAKVPSSVGVPRQYMPRALLRGLPGKALARSAIKTYKS